MNDFILGMLQKQVSLAFYLLPVDVEVNGDHKFFTFFQSHLENWGKLHTFMMLCIIITACSFLLYIHSFSLLGYAITFFCTFA
jgi:hypothetical protein